ncbi:unnamed protein product [Closterium sp. NIES-64]|nr:unnamed protein product [Closterium sp. NIES-64]
MDATICNVTRCCHAMCKMCCHVQDVLPCARCAAMCKMCCHVARCAAMCKMCCHVQDVLPCANLFPTASSFMPSHAMHCSPLFSLSPPPCTHPSHHQMLYLHIPSRHPPSFPDLELPPSIQTAALVGVGLLHMGSAHRLTTEILL